jgi:hypothetical protein
MNGMGVTTGTEHPWPLGDWVACRELDGEMARVGASVVTVEFFGDTEYWLASVEDASGVMHYWHGMGWFVCG